MKYLKKITKKTRAPYLFFRNVFYMDDSMWCTGACAVFVKKGKGWEVHRYVNRKRCLLQDWKDTYANHGEVWGSGEV